MKGNRGQALIEFILILPVILLILLYIVELGRVTLEKQRLEGNMDVVVDLYRKGKFDELNYYLDLNGVVVDYSRNDGFVTIKLSESFRSNMPFVSDVIGDSLITKRVIYEG